LIRIAAAIILAGGAAHIALMVSEFRREGAGARWRYRGRRFPVAWGRRIRARAALSARPGCWQCGKAAQDFAANALRSKAATIRLVSSSSYGRPVAVVTVDGADLGERLIRAGLATPQASYLRDDPARLRAYNAAFASARQRAGAFAGDWIEPSRWRHGNRLSCER
jgi:endonuclease YncB( thermonuclease family)